MLPTLSIGSITLPIYPFLLLIAFWVGTWLAARRASQLNLNDDHVYNATIYGLIAGLLGARFWYVLTHWDSYADDLTQALMISRSALAGGEGLLMAGLTVVIYTQYHKLPLGLFADATAPGLAVAAMIAHLGIFLEGQNLGLATTMPWGIELAQATRHPVHLYEALISALILGMIYLMRDIRPWAGFQFWLVILLYGTIRLLFEPFHANPSLVNDFLMAQIVGLLAMVVALAVMAYNFRKPKNLHNL